MIVAKHWRWLVARFCIILPLFNLSWATHLFWSTHIQIPVLKGSMGQQRLSLKTIGRVVQTLSFAAAPCFSWGPDMMIRGVNSVKVHHKLFKKDICIEISLREGASFRLACGKRCMGERVNGKLNSLEKFVEKVMIENEQITISCKPNNSRICNEDKTRASKHKTHVVRIGQ